LELKPGGDYTLSFKDTKGVESITAGRWKFEPFEGEPKVAVENFSSHLPNFASQREGVVLLGVQRNWGTIRLYASYSPDEYYSKKTGR